LIRIKEKQFCVKFFNVVKVFERQTSPQPIDAGIFSLSFMIAKTGIK